MRINKESWINHFKKLLNAEEDSTETKEENHKQRGREQGNWEVEEIAEDDFLNRDFGAEEVRQALNKMKTKKAAGEDGIAAEFYKNLPAEAMGISESFKTETGVRQGCSLSPILFNIFLEDLDVTLTKRKEEGTVIGKTKIFVMKFADDMVLLAEEAEGLRQMLKTLEKYVKKNKMEVNVTKTKIMVFRKGGKLKKEESRNFNGKELEIVGIYKYLGFWFSTTGTYSRQMRNVAGKAQKASNAGWGVMMSSRIKGLRRRAYLLDTLVKSGFMYSVEVWGWHNTNEWEKLQGRYMKMIMGLDRQTPAYICRLESGKTKVEVEARRRAGSYLLEIMDIGEERWPKACLLEEIRGLENNNPS
ncbi:uncharacterized protein LOC117173592 [Belonocnema kinseyi]|uniref:uncharacterized protein LOC117173592 n=1 Tax=Belonocnema kinseyi TaxID=2817044 RepID=UPI00143D6732|nr:uncharacterized protein LOC117173592 [Belonocnema kinseyi]